MPTGPGRREGTFLLRLLRSSKRLQLALGLGSGPGCLAACLQEATQAGLLFGCCFTQADDPLLLPDPGGDELLDTDALPLQGLKHQPPLLLCLEHGPGQAGLTLLLRLSGLGGLLAISLSGLPPGSGLMSLALGLPLAALGCRCHRLGFLPPALQVTKVLTQTSQPLLLLRAFATELHLLCTQVGEDCPGGRHLALEASQMSLLLVEDLQGLLRCLAPGLHLCSCLGGCLCQLLFPLPGLLGHDSPGLDPLPGSLQGPSLGLGLGQCLFEDLELARSYVQLLVEPAQPLLLLTGRASGLLTTLLPQGELLLHCTAPLLEPRFLRGDAATDLVLQLPELGPHGRGALVAWTCTCRYGHDQVVALGLDAVWRVLLQTDDEPSDGPALILELHGHHLIHHAVVHPQRALHCAHIRASDVDEDPKGVGQLEDREAGRAGA